MADTAIAITAGTGTNIDTRTEATNGNHRQVVVLGDPATNAGVAPVDATNGLAVQIIPALPAGTNAIGKLAANSGVDIGDVDITSIIPGTGATNMGKARDAVAGATDTGSASLLIVRASPTAVTPVAGDFEVPQISSNGEQWVRLAGEVADDSAFTVATTRVVPVGMMADETSTDSVDEGDAGIPRMTLDRKAIVTPQSHTNGGATAAKLVSAASTNATSLKGSAGQIYSIAAFNINAAVRYLKLYNKATAPTVGTDVPVHVFAIPGATTGGGFTISFPVGLEFTTGIAYALTTGITDADTGAVAASEILVNIGYK